jgi:hypothetical protein
MNDRLITYIEKDIFKTISNKEIMQQFQGMNSSKTIVIVLAASPA